VRLRAGRHVRGVARRKRQSGSPGATSAGGAYVLQRGIAATKSRFFATLRCAPTAAGHVILIPPCEKRICFFSRRAMKLAPSATASLARDLRVWPVRLFNRQSKGLTIFVCPNLQSAIFNRQSPILWGRLGNRPCDKRAPTKKSKKILDSPFC